MMFDSNSYFEKSKNNPKSFGYLLFLILISLHIYFLFTVNIFNTYIFFGSLICFILTYTYPSIFNYPNKAWIYFGILLAKIISPIIMGVIFYLILTPISIMIRIFKNDLLNEKFEKERNSYWIKRIKKPEALDKQY